MTVDDDLSALEERLGVAFTDRGLLERSLVHRSYLNENADSDSALASNERLEFLGDAILGLISAQYLYALEPSLSEGAMTRVRAALVRRETLARWARQIDLGQSLRLSRGEVAQGGRDRPILLASAFEALVAAIALDQGLEAARAFVLLLLAPDSEAIIAGQTAHDFKSRLQEVAQSLRQLTPTYRVVEISGPQHSPTYDVEVLVGEEVLGRGSGASKQNAEQTAAHEALAALGESR